MTKIKWIYASKFNKDKELMNKKAKIVACDIIGNVVIVFLQ